MSDNNSGWGGKREGAGRKSSSPEGVPRKQHQLRASDSEWEKIRLFAKILKDDPERADRMLMVK